MSEPIIFVDSSEVREGELEELEVAIRDLAAFVEANEPRPILYHVFLDPAGATITVVQVHPDSASMEAHMEMGGPVFARFVDLVQMRTMDIYRKSRGRSSTQ